MQAPDTRVARVVGAPLNRALGLELVQAGDGRALARFRAEGITLGLGGTAHAGSLYAMLDVVAFLALVPELGADEHAVTHDFHASLLRPLPEGAVCELHGRVVRRGRAVAFLDSEARVGDRLIATGRVTKSIVPAG